MSLSDFETKKSLHINLTRETHASLKICAFKNKLSMQEIFEELSRQIVESDPHMIKILSDLVEKKKNKIIKKISMTDAESIFRAIEDESLT
tara:strand:- start:2666 stop:2938 length:273 start_codon:yes stop_codon:yes gene_type:complete